MTKDPEPHSWRSYEDAFRSIVAQHQDVFGLDSVEPTAGHAEGSSGHVWDIEVIGYLWSPKDGHFRGSEEAKKH